MTQKPGIFFSYASEDREIVQQYLSVFRGQGYDVWIDFDQIEFGDSLSERINEALERPIALVFWSKTHKSKQWTREELSALIYAYVESRKAGGEPRLLIPVCIDSCTLPAILQHRIWAKSENPKELVDAISRSAGLDDSDSPEPATAASATHSAHELFQSLNLVQIDGLARQLVPQLQSREPSQHPELVSGLVAGVGQLVVKCLPRPAADPTLDECDGLMRQVDIRSRKIQEWQNDLSKGGWGVAEASFRIHLDDEMKLRDNARQELQRQLEGLVL